MFVNKLDVGFPLGGVGGVGTYTLSWQLRQ